MVEQLFRSVKRVCYAGLEPVALRQEIAARLLPHLGFDGSAFATCDPDTGLLTHVVAHRFPAEMAASYVEHLSPDHGGRFTMGGPRRQLHTSFFSGGRLWGTWCLVGAHPARGDARARGLLRRLVPHIARGLQSGARIHTGVMPQASGSEMGAGVVVLDERNRPVLRTPLLASWLADLADVGIRMPHDLPLALLATVARLRRLPGDDTRALRVRLRGASGRWYTMRASLAQPDESGRCATVIVVQPSAAREVASLLTQLYDLSAREREVVAGVARGESTKEIALSLGLSAYTVVEHIERACQKIGVRGRKSLIAKLFFDRYTPFPGDTPRAAPSNSPADLAHGSRGR